MDKLKVDTRITVETPEGVDFQFRLAGPGKRGIAWFLDLLIISALVVLLVMGLTLILPFASRLMGMAQGLMLLTVFAMQWLYWSLFETFWHGKTPGKWATNLRVVRSNGTPIGFLEAFGRNLMRAADSLPLYTVGMISMLMTRRMQRTGDVVFDTMVIDESQGFGGQIELPPGLVPVSRSECTKTYRVPERTLAIIERLFDTRRPISGPRREEIAEVLSIALQRRLGYQPAPAPYQITDDGSGEHTLFLQRILLTFAQRGGPPRAADPVAPDHDSIPIAQVVTPTQAPVMIIEGDEPE